MRSIELTFDPATEAAFRDEWAALQEAGLPNLGRHPDASNRPHLTLAAGPALELTEALRAVFAASGSDGAPRDGAPRDSAAQGGAARAGDSQQSVAPLPVALPVTLSVSGLVLFRAGADRFVLARPVLMTRALLELHRRVLDRAPGASELTQPDRWTPHITLARRLNAEQVAAALGVLGDPPPPGSCVAARFWNGETKTLTTLAG